jgi:hypothetical protein
MKIEDSKKSEKAPIVVIYRNSDRVKTHKMVIFMNHHIDDIISATRRTLLLPIECVFDDVFIGKSCIELYKKKYKIKNYETVE